MTINLEKTHKSIHENKEDRIGQLLENKTNDRHQDRQTIRNEKIQHVHPKKENKNGLQIRRPKYSIQLTQPNTQPKPIRYTTRYPL